MNEWEFLSDIRFWIGCVVLMLLSLGYDRLLVERLRLSRHPNGTYIRRMNGITWITVVIGVAYTLGMGMFLSLVGVALDLPTLIAILLLFGFSGPPMGLGEIKHHWNKLAAGQKHQREHAIRGDKSIND